jgi:hypothetical protein
MTDFYHAELQPWVHYVPVRMDLGDLPEKLKWADSNPDEAEKIARAGSDFMVAMREPAMVEHLLNKYVRDATAGVVWNYRHANGVGRCTTR